MTAPDNERPPTGDVRVSDEALRRAAEAVNEWWGHWWGVRDPKAVATAALSASGYPQRVAELEHERDGWKNEAYNRQRRVDELEAENTRLREALDWALGYVESEYQTTSGTHPVFVTACEIRAALASATKGSPRACEASTMQPKETE